MEKKEKCQVDVNVFSSSRSQRRRSGVFIVNFEHISRFFLLFLFSSNQYLLACLFALNIKS